MKKVLFIAVAAIATLAFSSCKDTKCTCTEKNTGVSAGRGWYQYTLFMAQMQAKPGFAGFLKSVTVCSQNLQQKITFNRHSVCEVIAWPEF